MVSRAPSVLGCVCSVVRRKICPDLTHRRGLRVIISVTAAETASRCGFKKFKEKVFGLN